MLPRFRPDLVLLDVMLPDIDGFEVCRRIRELEGHRFTKIILVSARSAVPDRPEGHRAGADDHLTKPFDHDEFRAKVAVFLRLKQTEEVDRLKGDLLRLLSHETRTPLNGILVASRLLLDRSDLGQ
jgi:DNA-binding response OmpR family regulator